MPPSIQRKARLKPGDRVEFKAAPGTITIVARPRAADDEYTPEQRRIIDARLAKSDEDIKRGRLYGPFDTHEQFIASLHKEASKLCAREAKRKTR